MSRQVFAAVPSIRKIPKNRPRKVPQKKSNTCNMTQSLDSSSGSLYQHFLAGVQSVQTSENANDSGLPLGDITFRTDNTDGHLLNSSVTEKRSYVVPELFWQDKVRSLEAEIESLKQEIQCKDTEIVSLRTQNEKEQNKNSELRGLMSDLGKVHNAQVVEKAKSLLSDKLTSNQVNLMLGLKKRVNWTGEELSQGFTLRYFSSPGYEYLTRTLEYPLPKPSCLRNYASRMDMRQGFLDEVLAILKATSLHMSEFDRVCVVQYDEMSCKEVYEYDRKHDDVLGPHTKMQVIMIRGLFRNWKQPMYAAFDVSMTLDLLLTAVTKIYEAGFEVVASVSDCGGGNVGIWSSVNLEDKKTFILHPVTQHKLFLFADAPHVLKLTRNWLIDTGFKLPDGTVIKYDTLWDLVVRGRTEVSDTFFLRQEHLTCQRSQRQNVEMAAQVCSRKCAVALQRRVGTPEAKTLSQFLLTVNDWWDVFNSRCTNESQILKKPYGLHLSEQDEALQEMQTFMCNALPTNKNTMQLFQKAILMSIISLQGLYEEMKNRFGASYIMTAKLNQDPLECLYSMMRARGGGNDHPSPLECLRRLRVIILGKSLQSVSSGQCTKDKSTGEQFMIMDVLKTSKASSSQSETNPDELLVEDDPAFDEILQETQDWFETEQDGFEYVAGAVARKFKTKFPYVGDYTYKERDQHIRISTYTLLDHDYAYPNSYVDHLSLGGLVKPSTEWLKQAQELETFFKCYHKDTIRKEKGLVKMLSKLAHSKFPVIPLEIVEHFIKLRTYIRISTLNRMIKETKQAKQSVKSLEKPLNKPMEPKKKKMKKVLI